jgi:hypothetical protein
MLKYSSSVTCCLVNGFSYVTVFVTTATPD